MKHRAVFVFFCLTPFLLALFIAPLRPLLREQLLGSYHAPLARWPWTTWLYGDRITARKREIARLASIARQQPDNATLQIKLDEWQADYNTPSYGESRARADWKLLPRYPNVAWLTADYLRFSTQHWFGTRTREVPEMQASSFLTPIHPDWQRVVDVAQHGRALEPNNTYFDWMLLHGLLEQHRDIEAMEVLHDAAHKTIYDDHINDDTRADLAALQAASGPQSLEARFNVAGGQLYPHLAMTRNLGRILGWLGRRAQHDGNHPQALIIYDDLAQLSGTLHRNLDFIHPRVGASMQVAAWHSCTMGLKVTPVSGTVDMSAEALAAGRSFAAYAKAHGRADLAASTLKMARNNAAFWRSVPPEDGTWHDPDDFLGVPNTRLRLIFDLSKMSFALVAQIALLLMGIATLTLSHTLFLRWPLRKRVTPNMVAPTINLRAVTILFGILGLLHALIVVFAVYWLLGSENSTEQLLFSDSLTDLPREALAAPLILVLSPLCLTPLVVSAAMLWRVRRWHKANHAEQTPAIARFLSALSAWQILPFSLAWAWFAASCMAWTLFFWSRYSNQNSFAISFPYLDSNPQLSIPIGSIWLALALSAIWLLPLVWRSWHNAAQPTPWRGYGALWLRRVWALHLALACWTWFVLLALSLPARRAADTQFAAYMQRSDLRAAQSRATLP